MSSQPASDSYGAWRDRLAQGINPMFWNAGLMDQALVNGEAFFIATDKAAMIFEIKEYPTGARVGHVVLSAGDKGEIVGPLREFAESFTKAAGCIGALVESRSGWARALKPYGYQPLQTSVFKEY